MITLRRAIFNLAAAGASLTVEQGGAVVTTTAPALSVARSVRGTIGMMAYSSYAEFIVYGDATTIANKVSVGVLSEVASLNNYVGGDNYGIGYRVAEGQIHRGGVSIAAVAAGGLGSVVGVLLTHGDGSRAVAFYLDGVLQHVETVILESPTDPLFGVPLFFGASVGSTLEGDIEIMVNSGRRQFEYPSALSSGWWEAPTMPGKIRISDVDFLSAPTDSPPHARYKGCLAVTGYQTSRSLNFWPWGDSRIEGGSVALTFTDPAHEFDRVLSGRFRDTSILLRFTETTLDAATTIADLVFERAEVADDLTKRIIGRDLLARIASTPLQTRYFRPDATGGAANRAWPLTLGAAFSVPVVLFDDEARRYAIDSVGVEGIGLVRDAGVVLEQAGSPLGYVLEASGQALDLGDIPLGVVTADVAVTGDSYVPPVVVDAIGGSGNPFADAGGGDIVDFDRFQDDPGIPDSTPYYYGGGYVAFPQNYMNRSRIKHQTATLDLGKRYRVRITVAQMGGFAPGSALAAEVGLTRLDDRFSSFWALNTTNFYSGNPFGLPRSYTFAYSPPVTHDVTVYFSGNEINGGTPTLVGALSFEEIPNPSGIDEEAIEDALAALAMPLEDMLRAILTERGPFLESQWNAADAAAIDTATGYVGTGFHATENALCDQAIDEVLVGYTACPFLDRAGVLRVARMIAPEEVPVDERFGELRVERMLGPLTYRRDDAPGLTRSMGARRNERVLSDGDLKTTDPAVTLRLRKKLSRTHRYVETSGANLAPGYQHVEGADYVGSRLVMPADARTEINRVCEIYTVDRGFYPVETVYLDGLELGDVLTVYYPFYGLDDGVALRVVEIEEDRINRTMSLILWGLAQAEGV